MQSVAGMASAPFVYGGRIFAIPCATPVIPNFAGITPDPIVLVKVGIDVLGTGRTSLFGRRLRFSLVLLLYLWFMHRIRGRRSGFFYDL